MRSKASHSLIFLAILLIIPLGKWRSVAGSQPAPDDNPLLNITLWPHGIIPYQFDDGSFGPVAVHQDDQDLIEAQMVRWEHALTLADPAGGNPSQYIDFVPCGLACRGNYLVIRYNRLADPDRDGVGIETECNNMSDPVGMNPNPDGVTQLHFRRGTCPAAPDQPKIVDNNDRTNQDTNTILHELGHVLGLWHEFNRVDADAYLVEQTCVINGINVDDADAEDFNQCFNHDRGIGYMPILGNYDYDSVMGYSGELDLWNNSFNRKSAEEKTVKANPRGVYALDYSISPGVLSRLLQYYAYELRNKWGFFGSLSAPPPPSAGNAGDTDITQRRNPYLSPNVIPLGTPTIALQSEGVYHAFVRGSDNNLYWKAVSFAIPAQWISLGCCFSSDPAAIGYGNGEIIVFAIDTDADTRRLRQIRYRNGVWENAVYVRDSSPARGFKPSDPLDLSGDYLGPAVASRGANLLDVFVVNGDGLLVVTTYRNDSWSEWQTLGQGYNVTARPAAVALSDSEVQLAINADNSNLYEPLVTFGQTVTVELGNLRGTTASQAPPALTSRDDPDNPYRVLIATTDNRISHRFANGSWRDVGGMVKPGTGPSAVTEGASGAYIIINGADLIGCDASCDDPDNKNANGTYIEPGGLWVRHFR